VPLKAAGINGDAAAEGAPGEGFCHTGHSTLSCGTV